MREESTGKEVEMVWACDKKIQDCVIRKIMGIEVPWKRSRGRPNMKWWNSVRADLREKGLSGEKVHDRAPWRRISSYNDHTKI